MGRNLTNISSSSSEYTRHYSGFCGVALGVDPASIPKDRLSECENMYRDYESDSGAVESVPGFRRIASLGGEIHALHRQRLEGSDRILIHAGAHLYAITEDEIAGGASPRLIAEIGNVPTRGFSFGGCYYLLCGDRILVVDRLGVCLSVGEEGAMPYTPTTHISGTPYEPRNLLCDSFYEEYNISDPSLYVHGTHGLRYEITDTASALCAVVGCDEDVEGAVYIPTYTYFGSSRYRVDSIADRAFSGNQRITEVHISEGLTSIGKLAFYNATALKQVITPDSITKIEAGAFGNCSALCEMHLGRSLISFGLNVFSFCFDLDRITYGADAETFDGIENNNVIGEATVEYEVKKEGVRIELPLHSQVLKIDTLTLRAEEREFITLYEGDLAVSVLYDAPGAWEVGGANLRVGGRLKPFYSSFGSSPDGEDEVRGIDAIGGCRISELFDGRVFLSGNPRLRGTVFYSHRDKTGMNNPLYFAVNNYFQDGMGRTPIRSMLAVRDRLAVFKEDDDGCGSILYHQPKETSDDLLPKIYPVEYVHSGLGACGDAISFLDDPVFVSEIGICALAAQAINYRRNVVCRSHNVNFDLLTKDPSSLSLALWCGYLAVCAEGTVYLADSRSTFRHQTGGVEYDWFVMRGVGTYSGAERVYRYSSMAAGDHLVHPSSGDVCYGTVYSTVAEDGQTLYYSKDGDKRYSVYPTDQMVGGVFSPATVLLSISDRLIFGTPSGDVCVFNNDMRGVPPPRVRDAADFDPEEYGRKMSRRIHPYYYAFDDHAPTYRLSTALDDCSIPHLLKDTVKRSAVIKIGGYATPEINVEVGTDRHGYTHIATLPSSSLDFSELDFSRLSFDMADHATLPVDERERGWLEKQYTVFGNGFRSPFGIYSITYRYRIRGRIKKR